MGRYYNPVSDIVDRSVGRFLIPTSNFESAKRQLQPGEHLYALCDRLIFKFVVCLDDESEFEGFYGQYTAGMLTSFDLVAFSETEHQSATD